MAEVNSEVAGRLDVPDHLPVGARVVEALERGIESSEGPPDAFEEPRRAFSAVDERCPVEVGDHPRPTHPAVRVQRQDPFARPRGKDLRHELGDRCAGEVGEGLDLALDHLPVAPGRRHLENETVAAGGDEHEIPVDLAREGLGPGFDAPVLASDTLGELSRERVCDCHSKILSPRAL